MFGDNKRDHKSWHILQGSCGLGFNYINPLNLRYTHAAGATVTLSYRSGDRPAELLPRLRWLGFEHRLA